MGYRLQREDGNLVRKFRVEGHNKAACEAELWYYGFEDVKTFQFAKEYTEHPQFMVWYKRDNDWHILLAGPEAYRQYAE